MYITNIDTILSGVLDSTQVVCDEANLKSREGFGTQVEELDGYLQSVYDGISLEEIQSQVGRIRTAQAIIEILHKYAAFYLFSYIGYYYEGTLQAFRNNLIQYASLHKAAGETVHLTPDVIYSIVSWREKIEIIRDYLPLGEVRREATIGATVATEFLEAWGEDYVRTNLLQDGEVVANNLLKTVIFGMVYPEEDRQHILTILQDSEEEKSEFTYIQVISSSDIYHSLDLFTSLFPSDAISQSLARHYWKKGPSTEPPNPPLDWLLTSYGISPITSDFLRYHRDSAKIGEGVGVLRGFTDMTNDNAEDNRASTVVKEVDAITERWSTAIRGDENNAEAVDRLFQNPLTYREAVMHNHTEEVATLSRIVEGGQSEVENNEYYLELDYIVHHSYFSYRTPPPILQSHYDHRLVLPHPNLLRFSNIEFAEGYADRSLELRGAESGSTLILSGLALLPLQYCVIPHRGAMRQIGWGELVDQAVGRLISGVRVTGEEYPVLVRDDAAEKNLRVPYCLENMTEDALSSAVAKLQSACHEKLVEILGSLEGKSIAYAYSTIHHWLSYCRLPRDWWTVESYIRQHYLPTVGVAERKARPLPKKLEPVTFQRDMAKVVPVTEIDLRNYVRPIPYQVVRLTSEGGKGDLRETSVCQHEYDWKTIQDLALISVNQYNEAIEKYLSNYAIQTDDDGYICNICSARLPISPEVQTTWSNSSYYVSYIPPKVELTDVEEYVDYEPLISAVESLIRRMAKIVGIRLYSGMEERATERRTLLVKNVLDLTIHHNRASLEKNPGDMSVYGVSEPLDSVYYYRVDPSMLAENFAADSTEVTEVLLKRDNLILYFLYVFFSELTPGQIIHMAHTRRANIHTFTHALQPIFSKLRIRPSVSDGDSIPITDWPVLCYLIYMYSYSLTRHGIWKSTTSTRKGFDTKVQLIIIHSIVDMINAISIGACRNPENYVYRQATFNFYSVSHSLFRNSEVIDMLVVEHAKYATGISVTQGPPPIIMDPLTLEQYSQISLGDRVVMPYSIRHGLPFQDASHLEYPITWKLDGITTCPSGEYYQWVSRDGEFTDLSCGAQLDTIEEGDSHLQAVYHRVVREMSAIHCPDGAPHRWEDGVCLSCGQSQTTPLPAEKAVEESLQWRADITTLPPTVDTSACAEYRPRVWESGLVPVLLTILGRETQVGTVKRGALDLPVYLTDELYAIKAGHLGKPLENPVLIRESEGRVKTNLDHTHYGTGVYYYTDKKNDVDVFYDLITLQQLGYKPRHDEYQTVEGVELTVIPSVSDQLAVLGWPRHYYRFEEVESLGGMIRGTLHALKNIVSTVKSILWTVHNGRCAAMSGEKGILCSRYRDLRFSMEDGEGTVFEDWNCLSTTMRCTTDPEGEVGIWKHTRLSTLDPAVDVIKKYLDHSLMRILRIKENSTVQTPLAQLIVDIIIYLHSQNTQRGTGDSRSAQFKYLSRISYGKDDGEAKVEVDDFTMLYADESDMRTDNDEDGVNLAEYFSADDMEE